MRGLSLSAVVLILADESSGSAALAIPCGGDVQARDFITISQGSSDVARSDVCRYSGSQLVTDGSRVVM